MPGVYLNCKVDSYAKDLKFKAVFLIGCFCPSRLSKVDAGRAPKWFKKMRKSAEKLK